MLAPAEPLGLPPAEPLGLPPELFAFELPELLPPDPFTFAPPGPPVSAPLELDELPPLAEFRAVAGEQATLAHAQMQAIATILVLLISA